MSCILCYECSVWGFLLLICSLLSIWVLLPLCIVTCLEQSKFDSAREQIVCTKLGNGITKVGLGESSVTNSMKVFCRCSVRLGTAVLFFILGLEGEISDYLYVWLATLDLAETSSSWISISLPFRSPSSMNFCGFAVFGYHSLHSPLYPGNLDALAFFSTASRNI